MPDLVKIVTFTGVLLLAAAAAAQSHQNNVLHDAEGLWEYTGLVTSDGKSLPLTGVFLIKDGTFLQQSIFNGEPFESQGSMAHVGPYWAGGAGIRLKSNPTLSLDPNAEAPLTDLGLREHDLSVAREGDELTLVFGGGTSTVQTFRLLGDGSDAERFDFSNGALAFSNNYFILVVGDSDSAVTGYGTYSRDGDTLILAVIRWAESDGSNVVNLQDVTVRATFDGKMLTLPDGKSFRVENSSADRG